MTTEIVRSVNEMPALRLEAGEIELIKRTIAEGATDDELKLFLFDCRRQGVHPLDKLVHFNNRGGRYTPITSVDFMRIRAADTGESAGQDDLTYDQPEDSDRQIRWARACVYRFVQGQRVPFPATARWSEYFPGDKQGFIWRKMPRLMLGKCAEALALRKAFPKQLHGLYERAEMDQAGLPTPPPGPAEQVRGVSDITTVHSEPADEASTLFPAPMTPLGEEHQTLDQKIGQHTPSRIAVMMRRFDLGEGEWQKLDLASKAMLAKHLEAKAK